MWALNSPILLTMFSWVFLIFVRECAMLSSFLFNCWRFLTNACSDLPLASTGDIYSQLTVSMFVKLLTDGRMCYRLFNKSKNKSMIWFQACHENAPLNLGSSIDTTYQSVKTMDWRITNSYRRILCPMESTEAFTSFIGLAMWTVSH